MDYKEKFEALLKDPGFISETRHCVSVNDLVRVLERYDIPQEVTLSELKDYFLDSVDRAQRA